MENMEFDCPEPRTENCPGINTDDWRGAHWQPVRFGMGSIFDMYGFLWYRILCGDTLAKIAHDFGTTTSQLKINNPATIRDISRIYAGDAIIIRRSYGRC